MICSLVLSSYDDGVSDTEDGPCPPLPDSADIDELSETECDRHHNSWIVIRGEWEEVNAASANRKAINWKLGLMTSC